MLRNMMEQLVAEVMAEHWDSLQMPCSCEICRNDILALSLNALPPHYVSNDKGRIIEATRMLKEQSVIDVLREVTKAAAVVKAKPSHN